MDQSSSRSSLIYNIEVSYKINDNICQVGKITFADLAGSERIHKAGIHSQYHL
jgi:hypothetical protein